MEVSRRLRAYGKLTLGGLSLGLPLADLLQSERLAAQKQAEKFPPPRLSRTGAA